MAGAEVAAGPAPPADDVWGWRLRSLSSAPFAPREEPLQEADGALLLVHCNRDSIAVSRLGPGADSWEVLAEFHGDAVAHFRRSTPLLVTPNLLMLVATEDMAAYLLLELDTRAWRLMEVQVDDPFAAMRLPLAVRGGHARGGRALLMDVDFGLWDLQPATGRCELLGDLSDAVLTARGGGEAILTSGRYAYLLGDARLSRLDVLNCTCNIAPSTCSPSVPPKDYVVVLSPEDGPRTVAVTGRPSLQLHLLHFDTGHSVAVPLPSELQRTTPWMYTYLLGRGDVTLWDRDRTVATLPAAWQWRPERHPFYPRPTQRRVRAAVLSLTRQEVSMDLILTACGYLDPLGL
eukprot:EG_transcript_15102